MSCDARTLVIFRRDGLVMSQALMALPCNMAVGSHCALLRFGLILVQMAVRKALGTVPLSLVGQHHYSSSWWGRRRRRRHMRQRALLQTDGASQPG